MKRTVATLAVLLLVVVSVAKIEKVHLIPFSHQDIGFTGTQLEVESYYVQMYNDLPDFMESFPDFRFTVETFWQFECWLKSSPEPDLIELYRNYAREGRIEFGAAYGSMHTGFANDYVLSKALESSMNFARESGFPLTVCLMNDVPGYTADLPDILAGSGIGYFMSGINDAYPPALALEESHNLFYWEGPLGKRVLCWVSKDSYAEGYFLKSPSLLRNYINNLEISGYPYSDVAVMVAFDNAGYFPGAVAYLELYRGWDDNTGVELVVSTPYQFMRTMEEKYGRDLKVYRGDWSGWWEIVKSGGPYSAGAIRRVQRFARELDGDLERVDPELKSSMDLDLVLYGEHTSAVTAGWPGKLTLAENITSNASVVGFATDAYSTLERLLKKMRDTESPHELCLVALRDGQYHVEIPAQVREGESLLLEIGGEVFAGHAFSREYKDLWNVHTQGYYFLLPLKKGLNSATLKGYMTETEMKTDFDKLTRLDWRETGNGSIKVTVHRDGGSDLHLDLCLESYLTGSPEEFSQIDARISSYEMSFNGLKEVVTLDYDGRPLSQIILTAVSHGGLEITLVIDRTGLPKVPYRDHSINYVLSLCLDGITGLEYMGARSFLKIESELAGARPPFIPFDSFVILDRSGEKTVLASRQSFSFNLDGRLRFQLLRHYTYSATSDCGIVPLGENEPGAPDLLTFSFYIDTLENGGFDRAVAFVDAPFVLPAENGEER